MPEVTVRDLRNYGGDVLERVTKGEALTVTRDGHPVAALRPLPRRSLSAVARLTRWHRLLPVDAAALRDDIDTVTDATL